MKIGLIDTDGHNFPNLALMKISAWHKAQGDEVDWWWTDLNHYDIVYKSKVFSDAYTPDTVDPINCDRLVKGGTGYCITLGDDKREHFNRENDLLLPEEIESMTPDYTIYPQYSFALSMTSRGCPRGCPFCHVAAKEGRKAVKTGEVSQYWTGQREIKVLDPNITACADGISLINDYAATGAWIDFTQGIDARLLTDDHIAALNRCRIKNIHFAWDDMRKSEKVLRGLKLYREKGAVKDFRNLTVFVLTNYDTTMDENLTRVYRLRDMGFTPYVMIYDKPNAPQEVRRLQGWVNNKIVFRSCERFEDYLRM